MVRYLRYAKLAAVTAASLLILQACSGKTEVDPVAERQGEGKIHGTELRDIMRELKQVLYEKVESSELEREDARRRHALRLADTIDTLACKIGDYPKGETAVKLGSEDAIAYASYTQALRQQGEAIRQIATAYCMEELKGAMNTMVGICNRCHDRFRDKK
jgi:hypothetical protein